MPPTLAPLALAACVAAASQLPAPSAAPAQPAKPDPFAYDASIPLHFTALATETRDNLRLVDGTFTGAPGLPVSCSLILPPAPTSAPAVIFLHWGYTGREEFIPEGLALARRGVICLLLDAPFARPEPIRYNPAKPNADRDMYTRAVIDCRRAVDALRARPDIDPTRIAFVGHSFGGYIGAILSSAEPRIGSFAIMGAFPSLADAFRDEPALEPERAALGPEHLAAYLAEMRPLDAGPFLAAARPMSVLLQFASRDRDVSADQAQRLAAAAPSNTTAKTYLCGHELNDPQATTDRDEWLATRLSLSAGR